MKHRLVPLLLVLLLSLAACTGQGAAPRPSVAPVSEPESSSPAPEIVDPAPEPAEPGALPPPPEPVGERVFQRYREIPADWSTDESDFPAEWVRAALDAVNRGWERDTASFTRGWRHDFDGDGEGEAILLIRALPEDGYSFAGDSQFVYVNSAGETHLLLGGCDQYREDWRKMDIWLLQYPGFSHVVVKSGIDNLAGQCFMGIYRSVEGQIEELMQDNWIDTDDGLFLHVSGPQGHHTNYYFWDTAYDRYSGIGPVEMAPDAFLAVFDPDDPLPESSEYGAWPNTHAMEQGDSGLHSLTAADIDRVEVYGGRYYQVYFSEAYTAEHDDYLFTVRRNGADWALFFGPSPGWMNSIGGCGEVDAYDVDMDAAEQEALPPPEGDHA